MCLNPTSDTSGIKTITGSTKHRGGVGELADRMKHMLASGEFTDVQFVVGRQFGQDKVFSAHKSILCNSSKVFYSMICNSVAESCPLVIHFPDIPSDAFANLLSYVYTDSVEGINETNIFPTLHCADKFGLPLLVDACCECIIGCVTKENCLTMLENVNRWCPDLDNIVDKCMDIVDEFADAILRSEQFNSIGHDSLLMILQRNSLSVDENVVYVAVENWSMEACEKRSLEQSTANRREMLGAALFLVRFPLLNDIELAVGPVQSALLLSTELRDLFLYKHAPEKPALPFSTEPRRYIQHNFDLDAYKNREAVFAQHATMWCGKGHAFKSMRTIVRATDILQRGQRVHCLRGGATYCMRRGGKHVVEIDSQEVAVDFEDLTVPWKVWLHWKVKEIAQL
ncbi:BTB/POZ domain-containing protein 6-like [Paramacrobiotus metropolitanus]|uniref:BTB/POZ domain-containing protein 6-like n=1 Tax=Paramacrobiotus metropolitanus TaxID=2943436 RepID=UPI002445B9D8|nr:BTB/POZ domain-containing protein 6-like [Paramacrobiotus metropolitanus]